MSSSRCQEQCQKACEALISYAKGQASTAAQDNNPLALFGNVTASSSDVRVPILLEVSYIRAPDPCRVPTAIRLPNALHSESHVCIIVPEPAEKVDEELEADRVTNVSRIMDTSELNGRFSEPVARRSLAKSFDVFFVHPKLKKYPQILTGEFLDWQTPIWMSRTGETLSHQIRDTMHFTVCANRGFDNVSVLIGYSTWEPKTVAENLLVALEKVLEQCPAGWKDIGSLRVSGTILKKRVALPFYAHDYTETHADLFQAKEEVPAVISGGKTGRKSAAAAPPRKRAKR